MTYGYWTERLRSVFVERRSNADRRVGGCVVLVLRLCTQRESVNQTTPHEGTQTINLAVAATETLQLNRWTDLIIIFRCCETEYNFSSDSNLNPGIVAVARTVIVTQDYNTYLLRNFLS